MKRHSWTWALSVLVLAAVVFLLPYSAAAHIIKIFAAVVDDAIVGYAYFVGGGRADNCDTTISSPEGHIFAKLKTDKKGCFEFSPTVRCNHKIKVVHVAHDVAHEGMLIIEEQELAPSIQGKLSELPAPDEYNKSRRPPGNEKEDGQGGASVIGEETNGPRQADAVICVPKPESGDHKKGDKSE